MLALLLGWGGASIAWGERITVNDGDGWDGRIYRTIAERFPEPFPELSTYSGRRCLPSVVVHYTLAALDAPPSGPNILLAFRLYNLALYAVVLFALMAAADELGLGLRGKWLLFLFAFVNFANLKMYYFYGNLTDVWGLAFSTLALTAYLRRSTPGVLAATLVGSFAWPTLLPLTFGFLLFPRRLGEDLRVEPPDPWKGNAIAGIIALAATAASAHYIYRRSYLGPTPETFELSAMPLSLALLAAYLYFGLRPLLDGAALYRWRTYCNWRTGRGPILAVGCAAVGEVIFGQFSHLFPAEQLMTPRMFLRMLLVLGVSKPLIFGVSHIAWFGVVMIAAPFAWTSICRSAQRIGPGMILALCGAVAIAIDSESRAVCGFFPAVALLTAKHFERRMVHPAQWVALAILAFAMSHAWLPINLSPWPEVEHIDEFPMQALFMHIGPWMTTFSYKIQAAIIATVAVPIVWTILLKPNRDPLRNPNPVPMGDSGSAFVASGVAVVIGATFYASRLGWSDNPIGPVLLAVGLGLFLIHFAYGARALMALRWTVPDSWVVSDGALAFFGVIFVAGLGALIGPLAGFAVAVCGAALLLIRVWHTPPSAPWARLAFSVVGTVVLGLGLGTLTCSQHYHSPLYLESLAGGTAQSDALHHAAYANMIRTYGVASTGLDGLPAYRYHFGSHWLFAQCSTLLDMTVLDFYQLGYPVVFLPLLVYAIGVAGTAFTGAGASAGRTPIPWGVRTWVVVLAALIGWVPQSMSQLVYLFFGWYPAVSESYGVALVGLLLAVAAARPAFLRWREDPGTLSRADRIAAAVAFPPVVGALMVCKISVGPLLLAAAAYAFLRLGWRRPGWRGWLALGLCTPVVLALIPQVYNTVYSEAPVKIRRFFTSGLVDARSLPVFPILLLAWFLLALRIRSAAAGLRTLRDAVSGRLLDLECVGVVALLGITAAWLLRVRQDATYFFDVQTWVALSALLGALPSLPPLIAATGPWWKRLGTLSPANLPLVAVMLTVLGVVAFRCASEGYEFAVDNLHTRGFHGPPPGETDFPKRERIVEVERPLREGKFAAAWRSVRGKTRETEAKPDVKRDVLALLESLDRLPLSVKRRTILHIPKSNRAYWDIIPPEHGAHALAGPFIGPAVSGLAMLEGLPDASPSAGYGYGAYPPESFAQRSPPDLSARRQELCERAASMRFHRVIVMYLDAEGKPRLGEWPIGDAPFVLPP